MIGYQQTRPHSPLSLQPRRRKRAFFMSNDALAESLQVLEGKGYKPIYDRIVNAVIDAAWSRDYHFTVYPIYAPDGYQGITEEQQQRRAGREPAIIKGIMNAPKILGSVTGDWQVLIQPDRDENPVKIFPKPIPMTPQTPDKPISVSDTLDCIELLKKHIPEDAAADRAMLYTKYCMLQYGQVPETDETGDPYKMLTYTAEEQDAAAANERNEKLIQAAAKYKTYRASDLNKEEIPQIQWLWDGILQKQGTAVLAGESKVGKSWLALAIGLHAARGEKYLNWDMNKTDVLYLALDGMNKQRINERITEITGQGKPDNFTYYIPESGVPFPRIDETPGTFDVIKGIMLRDKQELGLNYGLIIIDLFSDVLPLQARTNDAYRQGRAEMNPFNTFARETKSMVMTITHFGKKKDENNPYNSIVGSVAMFSAADAGLLLYRKTLKDKDITLTVNGRDQIQDSYVLRGRTTFDYIGTTEDAARTYDEELYITHPIRKAIVELVNSAGGRVEGTAPEIKTTFETTTGKAIPYSKIDIGRFLSKYEEKFKEIDGIEISQDRHRSYVITKV